MPSSSMASDSASASFFGNVAPSAWHVVATLLAGATLCLVAFISRRLVFHPLTKYPGPKIAALTSMYEDYHEIYQNYDYIWEIKKMHRRYGPIVRINPHEIHINDPAFYSTLNSFKGKWDKDPHTAHQFANPHSSVGTVDHDLHRARKAAIQPFFAKQKIYELEPIIQAKAEHLCMRLKDYGSRDEVVPMRQALKCFCVDTIAEYCFAKSGNMMDEPEFALEHWRNFAKGLDMGMRARYLPKWFLPTVKAAPSWVRKSVGPGVEFFEQWHKDVGDKVDHIEANASHPAAEVSTHRTIFHQLLNSPELPVSDKARPRLVQEGAAMIGAGGETTSQILGIILFGLLDDKSKLKRLHKELEDIEPEDESSSIPSIRQLESLPFLTGCLKEGLRLRTGKIGRQQRVPKAHSVFYKDIEIMPGTICSMTPAFSQTDPDVFPDPHTFVPDRWIRADDSKRLQMDKYLVAFSKGTRMCTGASLANAMMYSCIAVLVLNLDMDLYETTAWDNEMAADDKRHYPLKESKGLRVTIKSR